MEKKPRTTESIFNVSMDKKEASNNSIVEPRNSFAVGQNQPTQMLQSSMSIR